MDSIDIERLTDLAAHRKRELAGERIQALDSRKQDYLSHLAVLSEYISPDDMLLFLGLCGFTLSAEEVANFVETGLSQYVITASITDGGFVPFFQVEESVKKHYGKELSEEQKRERHKCAHQFYKRIFAAVLCEADENTPENQVVLPDEELINLVVSPGGLIDFGAHSTQTPAFHAWSISRAFYWQHHLFELGMFEEASDITNSICFALARVGYSKLAKEMLARNIVVTKGLQQAVAMANLATLFRESQDHETALRLYWKCSWPLIRLRASRQLAGVFSEMSNVYRDRGCLSRALFFQHLSSVLRARLKDLKGRAICSNQLSILYRLLGRSRLALKYNQSAENHWRFAQDEVNLAKTLVTQGNLFNTMSKPLRALDCFEESLTITTRIGDLSEAASSISGKARAYLQLHNYEQAKELLEEAISLRQRSSDRRIGIEYQNMGTLYELKGNLPLALGWYQKALPLLQKYLPGFAPGCQQKITAIQRRLKSN